MLELILGAGSTVAVYRYALPMLRPRPLSESDKRREMLRQMLINPQAVSGFYGIVSGEREAAVLLGRMLEEGLVQISRGDSFGWHGCNMHTLTEEGRQLALWDKR
jgi:hypothetical protein